MSNISSVLSTTTQGSTTGDRVTIFQDLPLADRATRLTVMEMRNSDLQIINELVYRWCRILTRISKKSIDQSSIPSDTALEQYRKVLILDMIGSINMIRLATVLKRDERRMRMIGISKGCRINSTFATINSYIGRQAHIPPLLRLLVIYQDEFFIIKTFDLIKEFIQFTKTQVLLVVPKLDRREHDILNLTTNYQVLKCDFNVSRYDIGPAPIDSSADSYQSYLNRVYFKRCTPNRNLPDKVEGELKEDGLNLIFFKEPPKCEASTSSSSSSNYPPKRTKN